NVPSTSRTSGFTSVMREHSSFHGEDAAVGHQLRGRGAEPARHRPGCQDRKSTRLNSSHEKISYAVFCLKKKKITGRFTSVGLSEMCWSTLIPTSWIRPVSDLPARV